MLPEKEYIYIICQITYIYIYSNCVNESELCVLLSMHTHVSFCMRVCVCVFVNIETYVILMKTERKMKATKKF